MYVCISDNAGEGNKSHDYSPELLHQRTRIDDVARDKINRSQQTGITADTDGMR